jgi:hypothetical protein
MSPPIDGYGFEAKIDCGEVSAGGHAGFSQDRRCEQPAKPGRVLKHGKLIPGIEGDDRLHALSGDFRPAAAGRGFSVSLQPFVKNVARSYTKVLRSPITQAARSAHQ